MRVDNGYIEVLECRECGFIGTVDLYPIENNQAWCPKCGCVYLGYSQVPYGWYCQQKFEREALAKGFTQIAPNVWMREEK